MWVHCRLRFEFLGNWAIESATEREIVIERHPTVTSASSIPIISLWRNVLPPSVCSILLISLWITQFYFALADPDPCLPHARAVNCFASLLFLHLMFVCVVVGGPKGSGWDYGSSIRLWSLHCQSWPWDISRHESNALGGICWLCACCVRNPSQEEDHSH